MTLRNLKAGEMVCFPSDGDVRFAITVERAGLYDVYGGRAHLVEPAYAPPFDEATDLPELRCAVTGTVDAHDNCSCAGCSAARVRAR